MRIIFTGGGTLGSVTPLLAVAEEITRQKPETELLWIGTEKGVEAKTVGMAGLPFQAISSGKLRRYFSWQNITDVFRIIVGFFQAVKILKKWKPDIVVSAGSFVAVPVIWAAHVLKISVHVHQMDIRPGLANRLSAPFATSFSVAYEKSLSDFAKHNPVWTGNPIRPELLDKKKEDAVKYFGVKLDLPTVFILGGGTGAVSLNKLVVEAVSYLDSQINLIHLTGPGKEVAASEEAITYRKYHAFDVYQMAMAYAVSDLVVTRAGMGTLTELATLGKPTVIIPIPKSHQENNAAMFEKAGAVEVWPETTLSPKKLASDLKSLLGDVVRLQAFGEKMKKMNRDGAAKLMADLVLRKNS